MHYTAGMQLLLPGLDVEHRETGDVGGQYVGSKLDTAEGTAQRSGERRSQRGLAGSGNVFDQDVAGAEHGNQQQVDHLVLSYDHPADVFADRAELGNGFTLVHG